MLTFYKSIDIIIFFVGLFHVEEERELEPSRPILP